VKDEEIDKILKESAQSGQPLDPLVMARMGDSIRNSIRPSLRPVRPLPPAWLIVVGMVLACAAVSLAGAARAGFFGFAKMDLLERSVVFPALGLLACLAALGFVHQMIPASRVRVSPGALLALTCVALLATFADLFRDRSIDHFFSIGIACLVAGVVHAIPAGLLSWLLLRRGFAMNPVSAGLVAGILAGLAGVGMLELHCPNFEAAHILVWHTAVVPVSAALGAAIGWVHRLRVR
jgi:hypothetical protein